MRKLLFLLLAILLTCPACEQDQIISVSEQVVQLDIELSGFQSQPDSIWYEAWLIWMKKTDKGDSLQTESMGILEEHEDGSLTGCWDVNLGVLQGAQTVLVTLENDTVEVPGPHKLIAAKVEANSGTFTFGAEEILDFNLEDISGTYILDTPTDPDRSDPTAGIWFVVLDTVMTPKPSSIYTPADTTVQMLAGLMLPIPAEGWYYEGWVEINGMWVSTGTFAKPEGKDDNSLYGAGQGAEFPFPGEDFLTNAPAGLTFPTDLSGCKTYITLAYHYPAGSENPFDQPLVLLEGQIPASAQGQMVYHLQNVTASLPGGTVQITIKLYE